jgi:SWI/SNF-related matrix-associated actin-dependent regulator 1 of chromatin subfamily A
MKWYSSNNVCANDVDDKGLGKTAQIISFLGLLQSRGDSGPHLIVVPSSTAGVFNFEFR